MKHPAAFWDASALVPLCVHESTSNQAHSWLRISAPVVWWGSIVEIHSALHRLHRHGNLSIDGKQNAISRLVFLSRSWREVVPEASLRDLAVRSLESGSLRAADSFQLAAALTWCNERPSGKPFICGDRKLADSARAAGFPVRELSG